jgi:hypothetical protein
MYWPDFWDRLARRLDWLLDHAAYGVVTLGQRAGRAVWWQLRLGFARLSLLGRGFAIAVALYAAAWVSSRLGFDAAAHQFTEFSRRLLSLVLTAAIVRHLWSRFTRASRYSSWTGR